MGRISGRSKDLDSGRKREEDHLDYGNLGLPSALREHLKLHPGRFAELRLNLHYALTSRCGESLLVFVVISNFIIIALETDKLARDPDGRIKAMHVVNSMFLGIFLTEIVLRAFTYQRLFFLSGWNVVDAIIVLADAICTLCLPVLPVSSSLGTLRTISLMRLLRSVKIIQVVPKLALIVKGIIASAEVLLWGTGVLLTVLMIFSVFAVQIIHPINKRVATTGLYEDLMCERCPRSFESVFDSAVTFVQTTIAADNWGIVTIPVIEEAPWTLAFFAIVFITIQLVMMNLILSVIVETVQRVSQADRQELLKAKEKEFMRQSRELRNLCQSMDTDASGQLTKEEIVNGYDTNEYFRKLLTVMDIKREDMDIVFTILDKDSSGTILYDEFVDELYQMRTQADHTMLVFLKSNISQVMLSVDEIRRSIRTNHSELCENDCGRRIGSDEILSANSQERLRQEELRLERLRQQMQEELRELHQGITSRQEKFIEHLRDVTQTSPTSRWRSGVADARAAMANSAPAGDVTEQSLAHDGSLVNASLEHGETRRPCKDDDGVAPCWWASNSEHQGNGSADVGAKRMSSGSPKSKWPPTGDANLMPCCRV